MNKTTRRTLKMRIYRMISLFNFGSLMVTMLALFISLGIAISLISHLFSSNAAKQMSFQLKMDWNMAIKQNRIPKVYKGMSSSYKEIFDSLGQSYKFNDIEVPDMPNVDKKLNKLPVSIDKPIMPFIPNLMAVDYKIIKDSKVIYPTLKMNEQNNLIKEIRDSFMARLLNTTTTLKVNDDNGKEIATLVVQMNPDFIFVGYFGLLLLCILIFMISFSFSRVIAAMISNIIIKPVTELDKMMKQLADGELEAAMNTEIKLKKPVKEVESLARSSNIIMAKMHDYVNTLGNQKLELEAQNTNLQENGKSLEIVNQNLENKNIKLKNILDNVEQGFFMFKQDLHIHNEYSLICEKIFNGSIGNKTFVEVIYPNNKNMQQFIEELLYKLFNTDNNNRKIYLPLMPEEVTINNRVINIAYKFVRDEKFEESIMVIINDITEKRMLEKLMDEERSILKMVVKSIIDRDEFLELVKEFEEFIYQLNSEVTTFDNEHILRQIHTYKGNFSQYDMVNIVPDLNSLEDKLYEKQSDFTQEDINCDELSNALDKDIQIIISYAGKDFTREGEYCYIKKEKLIEIEQKIQQTLTIQECNVILPLIKNLRYKSVKELLKTYPGYIMKLSERLEKSIHQIEISGDEVLVDTNYYTKVIKALSHVFRNCIDHGIESEDERLEAGKDIAGEIKCEIKDIGDEFEIIISDDGRGIDLSNLKQKVIEEGLYLDREWDNMNARQQYELIFEQGITTKKEVTYLSGRGVGMSAVKESVSEVGGNITVESESGKGTKFTITLPKFDDNNGTGITTDEFIIELAKTAKYVLQKHTDDEYEISNIKYQNTITLNNITALISLSGSLNSIIMISVNKKMAENLVKHFIIDNLSDEELIRYVEDVVGEVTNTILGNVFGNFENKKGIFHIGLPAVLSNNEAYIKYTQSQIVALSLNHNEYELDINILMVNEEIDMNEI